MDFIGKVERKYDNVVVFWVEDVDANQEEVLKRSLEIGVMVCDYVRSLC